MRAAAEAWEILFEERERGFGDIRTNVGCNLSLSYSKPQTLIRGYFPEKNVNYKDRKHELGSGLH